MFSGIFSKIKDEIIKNIAIYIIGIVGILVVPFRDQLYNKFFGKSQAQTEIVKQVTAEPQVATPTVAKKASKQRAVHAPEPVTSDELAKPVTKKVKNKNKAVSTSDDVKPVMAVDPQPQAQIAAPVVTAAQPMKVAQTPKPQAAVVAQPASSQNNIGDM